MAAPRAAQRGHKAGGPGSRPPRGTHAAPHRNRRWWPALVVAVTAAVAVLGWRTLDLLPGEPAPTEVPAAASARPPSSERSRTHVTIGDDGTMTVRQSVTFLEPTGTVTVLVPHRSGLGGDFTPRVGPVIANGAAPDPQARPMGPGSRVRLTLPERAYRVLLEYGVRGVVLHTEPTRPERVLALVTPLVVAEARGLPARVVIDSVKVLNVGCLRGRGDLAGCGTHTRDRWTIETAAEPTAGDTGTSPRVDVVAQLDLASP